MYGVGVYSQYLEGEGRRPGAQGQPQLQNKVKISWGYTVLYLKKMKKGKGYSSGEECLLSMYEVPVLGTTSNKITKETAVDT